MRRPIFDPDTEAYWHHRSHTTHLQIPLLAPSRSPTMLTLAILIIVLCC